MTAIDSSLTAASSLLRQSMFSRIDANSDGKVGKAEFVAGKPKNVTDAQATDLYGKIDTGNTDGLTQDQLDAGLKANRPQPGGKVKLAQDVLSALQTLVQTANASGTDQAGRSGPPSSTQQFDAMDTDHDGKVSQTEFLAARPKDVSEDQATKLFASIDSTSTGSITEDQFAASGPKGPHGHHHHHGGGKPPDAATTTTADATSTTSAASTSTTSSSTTTTSTTDNATKALAALMDAIKSYASYNKPASDTSSLLSTTA